MSILTSKIEWIEAFLYSVYKMIHLLYNTSIYKEYNYVTSSMIMGCGQWCMYYGSGLSIITITICYEVISMCHNQRVGMARMRRRCAEHEKLPNSPSRKF